MDQCFSILSSEFKSEIQTVEDLFMKIKNSPISPKPDVEHLFFIWDWRAFITPHFTNKMLANHSHYHAFQVKRDEDRVALRAKKYPQDPSWFPSEGIKLVKDGTDYVHVDVAPFRAEDLNLDKIMSDIRSKFLPSLPDTDKRKVEASWEKLTSTLVQMPKKILPKMRLEELIQEKDTLADCELPNYLAEHTQPAMHPELTGDLHLLPEVEEREFHEDARKGIDVVLWTLSKSSRPWVGRIEEVLSDEEFLINWYERQTRSNTFKASRKPDGSSYVSKQAMSSVMFWQMSTNATEDSFELPPYQLKRIMHEYESHDKCYSDLN